MRRLSHPVAGLSPAAALAGLQQPVCAASGVLWKPPPPARPPATRTPSVLRRGPCTGRCRAATRGALCHLCGHTQMSLTTTPPRAWQPSAHRRGDTIAAVDWTAAIWLQTPQAVALPCPISALVEPEARRKQSQRRTRLFPLLAQLATLSGPKEGGEAYQVTPGGLAARLSAVSDTFPPCRSHKVVQMAEVN